MRGVGRELGLPEAMVQRQPFPGPGLAVRILGEVTADRLETLREPTGSSSKRSRPPAAAIWQSFAVLTPVRTSA